MNNKFIASMGVKPFTFTAASSRSTSGTAMIGCAFTGSTREAVMPVVDRVFARIGASDDLSTGQSTFMDSRQAGYVYPIAAICSAGNNFAQEYDIFAILFDPGRGGTRYQHL